MTSQVAVMNLALTKMGASERLIAPDQQGFAPEKLLEVWDDVRRSCLRGGKRAPRWNFAEQYRETAARVPSTANPLPWGWTGAYPIPPEALRLAEIVYPEAASAGEWRMAGGEILLKRDGPLRAWWTFDCPDVGRWDALFVQTFAARLAFETCDQITGLRDRKEDLFREWTDNLASAARVDSIENPPVETEESSWISARYTGPRNVWGDYRQ